MNVYVPRGRNSASICFSKGRVTVVAHKLLSYGTATAGDKYKPYLPGKILEMSFKICIGM